MAKSLGDKWLAMWRTLALAVPSIIVPEELNLLINPEHPDFSQLDLSQRRDFELDLRLLG